MPKLTQSYEEDLHQRLKDPAYAAEYLKAAIDDDEEDSDALFLLALRDVAKAHKMTQVAESTGLNRESLYKMLSGSGNPSLSSLKAVLKAIGLKLCIEPNAVTSAGATLDMHLRTFIPVDVAEHYWGHQTQPWIPGYRGTGQLAKRSENREFSYAA